MRTNSRSARAAQGLQIPRARRRKRADTSTRLAHLNRNIEYAGEAPQRTLTQARKLWKGIPVNKRMAAIKARRAEETQDDA